MLGLQKLKKTNSFDIKWPPFNILTLRQVHGFQSLLPEPAFADCFFLPWTVDIKWRNDNMKRIKEQKRGEVKKKEIEKIKKIKKKEKGKETKGEKKICWYLGPHRC